MKGGKTKAPHAHSSLVRDQSTHPKAVVGRRLPAGSRTRCTMPRKVAKRPAETDDTSNKQPKNEDVAPESVVADWRDQLYFWHGTVHTEDHGETTWQGTWIASDSGLPSMAEFSASENEFKLTSNDFLARDEVGLEEMCPFGRSGYFTGTYKLDNDGSGFRDYSDDVHRICFKDHTASWSLVAARGSCTFGEFISAGRLVFPQGNTPATLTLARRYLTEDDPRTKLSAWGALHQIDSKLEGREAPWKPLAGSLAS